MQFLAKIGATSLLNVGAATFALVELLREAATADATKQIIEAKTIKRKRFIIDAT